MKYTTTKDLCSVLCKRHQDCDMCDYVFRTRLSGGCVARGCTDGRLLLMMMMGISSFHILTFDRSSSNCSIHVRDNQWHCVHPAAIGQLKSRNCSQQLQRVIWICVFTSLQRENAVCKKRDTFLDLYVRHTTCASDVVARTRSFVESSEYGS
ncbi:hypothetical protein CBL_12497 [Carabus blaptoides fortunei]